MDCIFIHSFCGLALHVSICVMPNIFIFIDLFIFNHVQIGNLFCNKFLIDMS